MSRTITAEINIFISDEFEKAVKEFYNNDGTDNIEDEDIVNFIENNIKPAESKHESFEIEGGDTGGWFIHHIRRD